MANGIVMSKLVYLITVWGGAQQYLINALQVQQLAAARAVVGPRCWRWSKAKLLNSIGWLSVRQLVFFHTFLQTHKTIQTGVPKPLYHAFLSQYPYRTRNASNGLIRQRFTVTTSFKYRAVQCYNQVPADIRKGSVCAVKQKLKKWIKSNISID